MRRLNYIKLYEDWNSRIYESTNPGELKVIYADKNKGKYQHYKTVIKNPTKGFDSFKKDFLVHPQKYLTNSKSDFHQPTDGKGTPIPELKVGAFIKIDIATIMTAFVKVVQLYETAEGTFHATFVTLEGHPEKGYINFKISKEGDHDIKFEISSFSETNVLAPEEFARSEQKDSWFSMLKKLPSLLGGTGTSPLFTDISPERSKFMADLRKSEGDPNSDVWSNSGEKILIAKNVNKGKSKEGRG